MTAAPHARKRVLAGYLHEISTTRMDLAFLFMSAFAASTILPMSSEVVLGALAVAGTTEVWMLFVVATAGNTLGAVANWALGRYAASWRTRLVFAGRSQFRAGLSLVQSVGHLVLAVKLAARDRRSAHGWWQACCGPHSSPLCCSC